MKAEIPTSDGKIEVDFSEMEKRLGEKASTEMKRYFEELKTVSEAKKEPNGKGIVEAFEPDRKVKLVEEFQKGERCDAGKIKEQWTICVPKFAQYELAGHLRDFVWVTDAVKGISENCFI
jgi:hypothetical protein